MTERIRPTVTIPTAILAEICEVFDYHIGMSDDFGYDDETVEQLDKLLHECEKLIAATAENKTEETNDER